jgi:hypothetical protein
LLLGSGELLLRAEGLVALLNVSSASILHIFSLIRALVQSFFHRPIWRIQLLSKVQSQGEHTGIVTIVVVSRFMFFFDVVKNFKLPIFKINLRGIV